MALDNRANESAKAASFAAAGAVVLLTHAITDPGPAAGPRAGAAIGPLNEARDHLINCARLCSERSASALATEALELAETCAARAREVGIAIVVPWPFVYAPLGAIYSATIALGRQVADFALRVPEFADLEPVRDAAPDAARSSAAPLTWSPAAFPWPEPRGVRAAAPDGAHR